MEFFDPLPSKDLNKRKIKGKFQETIEPQEILLDKLAKQKEEELGISEKKFEVPLSSKILKVFYFLSALALLLLFSQTFYFQIIQGKKFTQLSHDNSLRIIFLRGERGVIYDRNFEQLVSNLPSFDLVLNKKDLPQNEEERKMIINEVASIIKKNPEEFQNEIEELKNTEMLVLENIPHETLLLLESKISKLPGFRIEKNTVREYKEGETFAHLIGYTGKINQKELESLEDYSISDYIGKIGLEKFYEEVLRGKPGKILIEKDALGRKRKETLLSLPEAGKSLQLYLDANLQRKIEESLWRTIRKVGARAGIAIAMDPNSGGILSLVSLPSFNNNLFSQGISQKELDKIINDPGKPLFNRAISGSYPTGSTIKPLVAAAALEEKIISPQKEINCQGEIVIPNPWDPSSPTIKKDWTTHGPTDLRKAIAESCNVYFYTIGGGYGSQEGLGVDRIKKYLQLFGWGEKTGIDLPGEMKGFIPDKAWKKETLNTEWVEGDTYNLAIGQGFIKITPLEVVSAFSAIANGGKLYQPRLVQKIIDSEKNIIEEFKPKIIRENFIDPHNLKIVREGMRQAVTGVNAPHASSVILNSLPVAVAAKTGTAELGKNYYHNWVTVFAPYENPQIVLTVVLENVPGVQAAALPVAKEVLEWYFSQRSNQNNNDNHL